MRSRVRASGGCLLAGLLLSGCMEMDLDTALRADGSGTIRVGIKLTEKFVEIVRRMEKLDPDGDLVKRTRQAAIPKPTAAQLEAAEVAGVRLLDFDAAVDEKRLFARYALEFRSLSALADAGRHLVTVTGNKGGDAAKGDSLSRDLRLTRDAQGVYTLLLNMEQEGKQQAAATTPAPKAPEPSGSDPAAEMKKAMEEMNKAVEMLSLMGELMGEAAKMRITVSLKVPGTVVDFDPPAGAKSKEGKVTWDYGFATFTGMAMSGKEESPLKTFRVRFRMPEGESIPDAALWVGRATPAPQVSTPRADPSTRFVVRLNRLDPGTTGTITVKNTSGSVLRLGGPVTQIVGPGDRLEIGGTGARVGVLALSGPCDLTLGKDMTLLASREGIAATGPDGRTWRSAKVRLDGAEVFAFFPSDAK